MEDGTPVPLVEEESLGWTIVSRREDDDLQVAAMAHTSDEEDAGEITADLAKASPRSKGNLEQEGWEEAFRGRQISEEELEEGGRQEGKQVQYEEEAAAEEEEEQSMMADVQQRDCRIWAWGEQVRKAIVDDGKQTLVQKQSQKHPAGLLWRASLMATLGFFGWALLSAGDGKNFRSVKSHPCNFKEGEPVLNPRIEN